MCSSMAMWSLRKENTLVDTLADFSRDNSMLTSFWGAMLLLNADVGDDRVCGAYEVYCRQTNQGPACAGVYHYFRM